MTKLVRKYLAHIFLKFFSILFYGKEGAKARAQLEKDRWDPLLAFFAFFLFWFWGLCVLLLALGATAKDTLSSIIVAITVPVVFVVYGIFTRKAGKRHVEEVRKLEQEQLNQKLQAEREAREKEAREQLEKQQKEEAITQLLQNTDNAKQLADFVSVAETYDKVQDISALWERLQPERNVLTEEITQLIQKALRTERMYGTVPGNGKKLSADIRNLLDANA